MGKKGEGAKKQPQRKSKKKEIEFNFSQLRRGLSFGVKKELIQFFSNSKQMLNQTKEELFLLNKRFDGFEYAFNALFKKEFFHFNTGQYAPVEPQAMSGSFAGLERSKEQDSNEFVINEKYLAALMNDEEGEDVKADNNAKSSSMINEEEEKSEPVKRQSKNKSSPPKRAQRQRERKENKDNSFDKDSDSFNNPESAEMDKPIINDTHQANNFNQELFDYKSYSNKQSNQGFALKKNTKQEPGQDNAWLNK